jgi:hypothetical protein
VVATALLGAWLDAAPRSHYRAGGSQRLSQVETVRADVASWTDDGSDSVPAGLDAVREIGAELKILLTG